MSYIALYRKWRPQIFEDVVEQEYIVQILKNAVAADRIAHAYLFCGTRGTGKTTMAKIFSRAINCENPIDNNPCNKCETCSGILSGNILDVIEIDAASNNSVDNIREIRDEVAYTPAKAKFKVYIIDEVHMLSTGAFNALLKTLEEPPPHIVFILATTEAHKLPVTILSRCQRYDFRRISIKSISNRIIEIAKSDNVNLHEDASMLIAKLADGALRDGISILDQCISVGKNEITYTDVISMIGVVDTSLLIDVIEKLHQNNIMGLLDIVSQLVTYGKDISKFVSDTITHLRNILIAKISKETSEFLDFSPESIEKLKESTDFWTIEEISLIIKELSSLENSLRWSIHPKTLLEVTLIKIAEKNFFNNYLNLEDRINALESKIDNIKVINSPLPVNKSYQNEPSNISDQFDDNNKKKLAISSNTINIKRDYIEDWESILNEFKTNKKMTIYSTLQGSNAVLKNNTLDIFLYDDFTFNDTFLNKPDNKKTVETLICSVLNREHIKVNYINKTKKNLKDNNDNFMRKIDSFKSDKSIPFNLMDDKS